VPDHRAEHRHGQRAADLAAGVEQARAHPGLLTLAHEALDLARSDGQRLFVYMATPGSADYDAMVLLDMAGSAVTSPRAPTGQTPFMIPSR
jgi:hypothetical protein